MAWTIEFVPVVRKELKKLGKVEAARIVATLEHRIALLDNPRSLGSPLGGELSGLWCWRIGDYRVVANIEDDRITILVVRIAHRREVYR